MTRDVTLATACLVLALACVIGALRCLSEHLLPSAAIYTVIALGFVAGAAKLATEAL